MIRSPSQLSPGYTACSYSPTPLPPSLLPPSLPSSSVRSLFTRVAHGARVPAVFTGAAESSRFSDVRHSLLKLLKCPGQAEHHVRQCVFFLFMCAYGELQRCAALYTASSKINSDPSRCGRIRVVLRRDVTTISITNTKYCFCKALGIFAT